MEIAHNRPPRIKQELHLIFMRIMLLSGVCFFNSVSTTYICASFPKMTNGLAFKNRHYEVHQYAILVPVAFFLGRLLSSYTWGSVIDRYGRRPGLLISLGSTSLLMLLFGCSATFTQTLTLTFLIGLVNGLSTICKALATEIVPDDLKAWSISITETFWTLGIAAGPVLGSTLANPNQDYPFLIPSIFIAAFGVLSLPLVYLIFKETLTNETAYQELQEGQIQRVQRDRRRFDEPAFLFSRRQLRYILNSPNTVKLISIFSLNTLFMPYWIVILEEIDGLDFQNRIIPKTFPFLIVFQFISPMFLYPILQKRLGDFWLLKASQWVFIPIFYFLPYVSVSPNHVWSTQEIYNICWIFVQNISSFIVFSALQRFINDTVSTKERGRLNGLCITFASLLQMVLASMALLSEFDHSFVLLVVCVITVGLLLIIGRLRFADTERRRSIIEVEHL